MPGYSRIPEIDLVKIKDGVDIVEVASRYLKLRQAGRLFKALCPFHKEKTPSFIITPDRQSYHCFGCGKGGNVYGLLMEMERISFPEAVQRLAKDISYELHLSPQAQAEIDEREVIYDVNEQAAVIFSRYLFSEDSEAKRTLDYVKGRKISNESIAQFRLGYAPNTWDFLINNLSDRFDEETLVKAGVVVKKESIQAFGRGIYDRFRGRLMFPIFDNSGRVIGFGARAMDKDDIKYLNSPETPIFRKGDFLYGMNFAIKAIRDSKHVRIVEGYTDAILAHQNGLENVVSSIGVSLTESHTDMLRRRFPGAKLELIFDGDEAGRRAALLAVENNIARADISVSILEPGKDPADIISSGQTLESGIAEKKPATVYLVEETSRQYKLDIKTLEGQVELLERLKPPIKSAPPEKQALVMEFLAKYLGTRIATVESVVINQDSERGKREYWKSRNWWEEAVVRTMLENPSLEVRRYVAEHLKPEDFKSLEARYTFLHLQQESRQILEENLLPLWKASSDAAIKDSVMKLAASEQVVLDENRLSRMLYFGNMNRMSIPFAVLGLKSCSIQYLTTQAHEKGNIPLDEIIGMMENFEAELRKRIEK